MSVRPEYEFVVELGQRFPDLTDSEVMEKVAEFEDGRETNPGSPVGLVLLQAYDGGIKCARRFSLAMFGIDMTEAT